MPSEITSSVSPGVVKFCGASWDGVRSMRNAAIMSVEERSASVSRTLVIRFWIWMLSPWTAAASSVA